MKHRHSTPKPGAKFHWFTVTHRTVRRHGRRYLVCRCRCGRMVSCAPSDLATARQKSCGCWRVEIARQHGFANKRHGESNSPLWMLWKGIKLRCQPSQSKRFPSYAGRGLTVCRAWRERYEAFRDWALANGYRTGLQIDRIRNDRGYSPGNCRFVTSKEQQNNRSNNVRIRAWGETKTAKQWSEDDRCAVGYVTLWGRLRSKKMKWTIREALTIPALGHGAARHARTATIATKV